MRKPELMEHEIEEAERLKHVNNTCYPTNYGRDVLIKENRDLKLRIKNLIEAAKTKGQRKRERKK